MKLNCHEITLVIELDQARITSKRPAVATAGFVRFGNLGDLNNVLLARRILAGQEAAVENQRLARHEGSPLRAHP